MGCSSGIPQLSQTRRLSRLPFYSKSFSRFPQDTYDVVPISASNDAFTWDDVGRISKTVQISGATRKRSKSAIALSLESHSEFLPFVIEDYSQRYLGCQCLVGACLNSLLLVSRDSKP
ncbi:unnamed protein product [Prunus armeniaca]